MTRDSSSADDVLITVFKVDLDIDDCDETNELSVGGFVPVNADNDNGSTVTNYIPDTRDFSTNPISGEDDLVELSLSLEPAGVPGELRLRKVESARDQIKVWTNQQKNVEIALPKTWDLSTDTVPSTLYVEGVKEGEDIRNIDLFLEYLPDGTVLCDDQVKVTVSPVLKQLDIANQGTPDYWEDPVFQKVLWSNGANGTNTVTITGAVWNVINPAGSLRPIQHVHSKTFAEAVATPDAVNVAGRKYTWNFMSPYGGSTLVDGEGSNTTWNPFYPDDDSSSDVFVMEDTPRVDCNPSQIYPAPGNATAMDIKSKFTTYAVWGFTNDIVYFLGHREWSVHYHGDLTNTAGTISFLSGTNNANSVDSGLIRDNVDERTEQPAANDKGAWLGPPRSGCRKDDMIVKNIGLAIYVYACVWVVHAIHAAPESTPQVSTKLVPAYICETNDVFSVAGFDRKEKVVYRFVGVQISREDLPQAGPYRDVLIFDRGTKPAVNTSTPGELRYPQGFFHHYGPIPYPVQNVAPPLECCVGFSSRLPPICSCKVVNA